MKEHEIWRSRRFMTTLFGSVVAILLLFLGEYTAVTIEPEPLVLLLVGLWGSLAGGYQVEDAIVAAKSGKRASKYSDAPE